jgi:hypothetical protein
MRTFQRGDIFNVILEKSGYQRLCIVTRVEATSAGLDDEELTALTVFIQYAPKDGKAGLGWFIARPLPDQTNPVRSLIKEGSRYIWTGKTADPETAWSIESFG